MNNELTFKQAFMYPFNKGSRMFNILWFLLPIFGWFALGGYGIRIVQEFVKGNYKELPKFMFFDNMGLGFLMFFKALPFVVLYMIFNALVGMIPIVGFVVSLVAGIFIVPMLFINFFVKEKMIALFEFGILKAVVEDLEDYVIMMLKSFGLQIIFGFMIIIFVGIPAGAFTKNIFMAEFYRKYVDKNTSLKKVTTKKAVKKKVKKKKK